MVVAATYHFVYEGMLLPSIRMSLRNQLFALRDEVRTLNIDGIDRCDDEAFEIVHSGINNYLNRLHLLTIGLHMRVSRLYETDAEFKTVVESRRALMDAAHNASLKDVVDRANKILFAAFVFNAGGWFIYIVPLAICVATIKRGVAFAKELFALPTSLASKLMPIVDANGLHPASLAMSSRVHT